MPLDLTNIRAGQATHRTLQLVAQHRCMTGKQILNRALATDKTVKKVLSKLVSQSALTCEPMHGPIADRVYLLGKRARYVLETVEERASDKSQAAASQQQRNPAFMALEKEFNEARQALLHASLEYASLLGSGREDAAADSLKKNSLRFASACTRYWKAGGHTKNFNIVRRWHG